MVGGEACSRKGFRWEPLLAVGSFPTRTVALTLMSSWARFKFDKVDPVGFSRNKAKQNKINMLGLDI
jgi:hypothetical protein